MGQVTLLHVSQDSKATLRRDEAADDFLSDVLGRGAEQVFELDGAEFLYNGRLLLD